MSINTVALVGRLARDPENRRTQSGTSVTSFTLAVDAGKDREAYFIDCVAWKGTADFVSSYFCKGMKVAVAGRLSTRIWEDKTGNKHKATEVVALNVEFAESKRGGSTGYASPAGGYAAAPSTGGNSFAEFADDDSDLPF